MDVTHNSWFVPLTIMAIPITEPLHRLKLLLHVCIDVHHVAYLIDAGIY